ncbi:DUF192 domain-containing protein [Thalassococcus sp. S3]|uniref:DUF192 domain-containing protein n=1 Tax=Thalassococcus sp. S3 TaxID=2017482 RepID=UPI0010240DAB|nr:DUF192 domain-containing protein [Thalassococcus sp. S3]QBF32180.1 hypothetical protein CFI11_13265 [Thalassococcus sp. S3]
MRVLAVLCALLWAGQVLANCASDRVSMRGEWGEARFQVELADTPQERSRGLMFREDLPTMSGMLFVYEYPQTVSFWMKNTLIPLDMIFVDRTGLVRGVHHEAIPGDLTPIPGGRDIFAVLEINGGLSRRMGISTGTQMRHPVFEGGPAIWPC